MLNDILFSQIGEPNEYPYGLIARCSNLQKFLQVVYHQCRERIRNIFGGHYTKYSEVESVCPTGDIHQVLYGEIGLGVYQQHHIVLRQSKMWETSRHWVISNIHSEDFRYVSEQLLCELCRLVLLLKVYRLCDHLRMDSRKLDEIILRIECPDSIPSPRLCEVEGASDNVLCPIQTKLLKEIGLDTQELPQAIYPCPVFYSTKSRGSTKNEPNH